MLIYNSSVRVSRHVGMADEADSKSVVGNHVRVQVPLPALFLKMVYTIFFLFINMMSGSKGQNPVRACTIRCLTLGPAKHEEVAIYVVNQRILNVLELRE